jgi:hypothetical protein
MASVVLLVSVAVYYSVEKIHEHKKAKRALQQQQLGIVEVLSSSTESLDHEQPPVYQKDGMCEEVEQEHTAMRGGKRGLRKFRMHF